MQDAVRKKCNLADIAALAGVAPSTVSRVLNGKDIKIRVSPGTREKIMELVKKFDYSPDVNATRLWAGRSNTIGLAIPTCFQRAGQSIFSDPPFTAMLSGIERAMIRTEYQLMLIFQNEAYFQHRKYLKLLKTKTLDGMIIWGAVNTDSYIGEIADFPVVVTNSEPSAGGPFHFVTSDNAAGSYELTRAMIGRGARRFGYFGGTGGANSIERERFRGFNRALAEGGLKPDAVVECVFEREPAMKAMELFLRRGRPALDLLVCASDELALYAYAVLKTFGVRVPEELLLAGADGLGNFNAGLFPLATYRVPAAQVGELAAEELFGQIKKTSREKVRRFLPVDLVIPPEFDQCIQGRWRK